MRNLFVCLFVLASGLASAEPADAPSVEVSLKAGAHFPQLMNKLGTSFDGILKLGYAPFEGRRIQLFLDLGYSRPSQTLTGSDPRLAEGSYQSTLVMQDLATTLGAVYFILPPASTLVPYAGAGLRLHFLKAEVTGASGSAFGVSTETDTRFGGVIFGGAGFHLGPGLLLGEVAVGYAPVGQKVTGVSNIGALSLLLGYGVLL